MLNIYGRWYQGKKLIAEFTENEELIFNQTVEWLTSKLSSTPAIIKL